MHATIQKRLAVLMHATLKPAYQYQAPTLQDRVEIVKVLLDEGANVNIQNEVRQW